jgi:hypothetical protein
MAWFRSDKSTKYTEALLKVSVNLFEVGTYDGRADHAPLVLKFERPDSKLRYMAFCLGTVYYFAVQQETLSTMDVALRNGWAHFGTMAMSPNGAQAFFNGPVDRAAAVKECGTEVMNTINSWKGYSSHFVARKANGESMDRDARSARVVCAMLRRVESPAVLAEDDVLRLTPLARWIEETTTVIESSVEQLAR